MCNIDLELSIPTTETVFNPYSTLFDYILALNFETTFAT